MRNILAIFFLTFLFTSFHLKENDEFTDNRDGKTYKIIKLGNQTWMAENLAYKPKTGVFSAWGDEESNVNKYGYLYNWETACNVCPKGWHLPNDNEWNILVQYLESAFNEATITGNQAFSPAMQIKSVSGWYEDQNGKNSSGFNALPGGACLFYDNSYWFLTEKAYFWSSTPDGVDAYARTLSYDNDLIDRSLFSKNNRMSVRCIKD
jgi:uncharacterized protein (TIGR02145 family)